MEGGMKGEMSVSEKIQWWKTHHPQTNRVYEFYVADSFGKIVTLAYDIHENVHNRDDIIGIVRIQFEKLRKRFNLEREELRCYRYSIDNGFREEYLLLDNGAYERSGIDERLTEMCKPYSVKQGDNMENHKITETKVKSYRIKKPVKAIRWTGDNLADVIAFTGLHESAKKWTWDEYAEVVKKEGFKIFSPNGSEVVPVGFYVIIGFNDNCFSCEPDAFEQTYIPAEESVCDPMAIQMIEIGKKVKVRNLENSPVMTVIDIMDGKGLIPMKPSAQCVWMKGSSMKSASFSIEALEIAITQ